MEARQETRWGWISEGGKGPNMDTYRTPDAALLGLQSKQGNDPEFTIEDAARAGIYLALVRVTVEPLMVMTPNAD